MKVNDQSHKIGLLSIGDELLLGQVINTNAAWLSEEFAALGLSVHVHLVVADQKQAIIEGLNYLRQSSQLIFVTGGLGPTKDDITKTALAAYFDDQLEFHEESFLRLEKIMLRYGRPADESQRLQCYLPTKAKILNNDMGTAPAMQFHQNDGHYFFMPGVPFEMKHLFTRHVIPFLASEGIVSDDLATCTILTAGIGESHLEEVITDIVNDFPTGMTISYLPAKAQVRLRLTTRNVQQAVLDQYRDRIVERLGTKVYGYHKVQLEEVVGEMLKQRKLTLGLAESCTGGAISARITSVPGASAYYHGSILSYTNQLKHQLLQVPNSIFQQHGAVSEPCVRAMVEGTLRNLNVDVAVAISGIAGPSGGSEEKPVGTAYIGVGNRTGIKVKRFNASKTRAVNIAYFTSYALNMLRLFLLEEDRS